MLNDFKVENCPSTAHYIPNFLSKEEEKFLLKSIYNVPQSCWTQLSKRRLQNWGGHPHPNGMLQETIPQWLQEYVDKVAIFDTFSNKCPNHVLINEYKPNEGIMPHSDGPLYFPSIATISLGSHTVLNFYKPEERDGSIFSLFLEPRSLLLLQADLYESYLHGIDEKEEDLLNDSTLNCNKEHPSNQSIKRGTRVSLTIRHVLKVSKLKLKIGSNFK